MLVGGTCETATQAAPHLGGLLGGGDMGAGTYWKEEEGFANRKMGEWV